VGAGSIFLTRSQRSERQYHYYLVVAATVLLAAVSSLAITCSLLLPV
jgi:hypothetical protein